MSKTSKKRAITEQDKINLSKGKKFTSDNQPSQENKQKGLDIYWQTKHLKDDLKRVCVQAYNRIADKDSVKNIIDKVKKFYPDIPEERISIGLAKFINCLSKADNPRDLKIMFELAGIVETRPQVEVSINNNVAPTKIDKDSLKALMEIMATKKKKDK